MDFCVVNFMIFVCVATKTSSWPIDSGESNENFEENVIELGKGISKIPPGYFSTKSINFGYNHLETLPSRIFTNSSYKFLHTIELSQNKINNISVEAFYGLRKLKTVDLSYNNLSSIHRETFVENTKLTKLDLSNNRIMFKAQKIFLLSPSLETLVLSNNDIDVIYEFNLLGLVKVRNLLLDNNPLIKISPSSFTSLNRLQYLSLTNTDIYRLSEDMFEKYPKIIDLTDTPLAEKFDPPLKKVKHQNIKNIINIDLRWYE